MAWAIKLFELGRGERPVEEFIKLLSEKSIAKVGHTINLLEKYGNTLRMPHSKKISKDLYELRVRGKEEIRIIYAFKKGGIYLLHGFKKKTQKAPVRELEIAKKRLDKI